MWVLCALLVLALPRVALGDLVIISGSFPVHSRLDLDALVLEFPGGESHEREFRASGDAWFDESVMADAAIGPALAQTVGEQRTAISATAFEGSGRISAHVVVSPLGFGAEGRGTATFHVIFEVTRSENYLFTASLAESVGTGSQFVEANALLFDGVTALIDTTQMHTPEVVIEETIHLQAGTRYVLRVSALAGGLLVVPDSGTADTSASFEFRLAAVPEPRRAVMCVTGLILLVATRRAAR